MACTAAAASSSSESKDARPDGPRRARKDVAVSASTTVTFSGRRPSTALATSCGMACCASRESAPPLHFYNHRGLRFALLLREQRIARQHQVRSEEHTSELQSLR